MIKRNIKSSYFLWALSRISHILAPIKEWQSKHITSRHYIIDGSCWQEPITTWCLIQIKVIWIKSTWFQNKKIFSKYENKTYILWVWPNSNAVETLKARKRHNGHDHSQVGSVLITPSSCNVLCHSLLLWLISQYLITDMQYTKSLK